MITFVKIIVITLLFEIIPRMNKKNYFLSIGNVMTYLEKNNIYNFNAEGMI